MIELLNQNVSNFITAGNRDFGDIHYIKKILKEINSQKMLIISGVRGVGKTSIVSHIIQKGKLERFTFYFNKDLDLNNKINSLASLNDLLSLHIKTIGNPKIILLENVGRVDGIKEFIKQLHTAKIYKVFLIGNDIKIPSVRDVEIRDSSPTIDENIINSGNLLLRRDSILLRDIYMTYKVKDIDMFTSILSYISNYDGLHSLRGFHSEFKAQGFPLSLATFIGYVDHSTNAKILKKVSVYDVKHDKAVNSSMKIFFSDLGIRNSFNNFSTQDNLLNENLVYNVLQTKGYENIFVGKNGNFYFSFLVKLHRLTIYIHISTQTKSNELKKEVRRLLKIGNNMPKYIILRKEVMENMKLKKLAYESVRIIPLEDFSNQI